MKISAILIAMISLTVIANLLLKQGAIEPASQRIVFGLYSWKSCLGFVAFAFAGLIYAIVLRWLPLNVAQSIASFQFVAVILASALILSENIPAMRWLGIALITAGILMVSTTVDSGRAEKSHADRREQVDG